MKYYLAQSVKLPDGQTIEGPVPQFTNLASVVNELVRFVFPLIGVILFVYLIFGGFEFLTSLGDDKKVAAAKSRITNAIIGFIIMFTAYWITQVASSIFKLNLF